MMGCSLGDNDCFDNEKPAREVTIAKGFWMGQTLVTSGAYKKYRLAQGKPSLPVELQVSKKLNEEGPEDHPAVAATWYEASEYCASMGMRLPEEAEWEYAARAGTLEARYGNLDDIAWHADNSGRNRIDSQKPWDSDRSNYVSRLAENGNAAHAVRGKAPNAWNLFDMQGKVWEWTASWYQDGKTKVARGASWFNVPRDIRVSNRNRFGPAGRYVNVGFRCIGE